MPILRFRTTLPFLVLVTVALCLYSSAPDASSKLDRAVLEWAREPTNAAMRLLIQTRPGRAARVQAALTRLGAGAVTPLTTPDLLVAELSPHALRAVTGDHNVTRISSDALVRTLGSSDLMNDVLLNTQALLPRTYTGEKIGIAVIDSGILPNANAKVVATYDFITANGKKVGAGDPFGHGTHVSGLIASNGTTSNDLYESIAPGARLIALRVLDQNGVGYTSNVIGAIHFAIANKDALQIDVINLSLGHPIYEPAASDPLVQAVEQAVAAGIVVVASAGNFGGDPTTHVSGYGGITSPGNAPGAITVGALETYNTVTRGDDVIAWYSSRGPTWYDGFQKPDLVAPGSRMVSDVPTSSNLARTYPLGLMKTSGTTNLMKLSCTSMAEGVVSGTVSLMLEASRKNHPGTRLTPHAVKAMLQYASLIMADADTLTQGAGSLNAAGAVALAEAIDPNQPVGSWWLTTGVPMATTVAGESLAWGQRIVWGDRVIWGNSLIGEIDGTRVIWGNLSTTVTADRVIWGNISSLLIAPTSLSWSNLEQANGDLMTK